MVVRGWRQGLDGAVFEWPRWGLGMIFPVEFLYFLSGWSNDIVIMEDDDSAQFWHCSFG